MQEQEGNGFGLPGPSVAPAILALGITLLGAGLVTSLFFTLAGAVVFAIGLGGWVQELRHG
jgi:hypothetical protein